jgi:hypothetical protein
MLINSLRMIGHSFAARLLDGGASIMLVQKILDEDGWFTHTCSVAHLFLCNYTITRLVRNVGWFLYSTTPLEQYTVRDRAKTETEFSNHSVTPQFLQFTLLAITGVQREIMGTGSPTYVTGVLHLNCVSSYSRIFQFIHLHTNFPH